MALSLSERPLSYGMQGDDVARFQSALAALGRYLPEDEVRDRVLGPGTLAVLKALQAEFGMPGGGTLDVNTIRAINRRLDALPGETRLVRGQVLDANGAPFTRGQALLHFQSGGHDLTIGKSPLGEGGSYEISYQLPTGAAAPVDVRVELTDDNGPLDTTPSGASILADAGALEVLDFVVGVKAKPPLSEFELLQNDLAPILEGRSLADLTELEVSTLALRSGYPVEQVAALAQAARLAKTTSQPPALFYGLVRGGLAADVHALAAAHPGLRLQSLQSAVSQGLVPAQVDGKKIGDYLGNLAPGILAPTVTDEVRPLLGSLLNVDQLQIFTRRFLENSQDPAKFWKAVETDPVLGPHKTDLQRRVQFAGLLNNHLPLVDAVAAKPEIRAAADLARLSKDAWKALITTQGTGVLPETPGNSDEEKAELYARQITRQVEAAFPTQYLGWRLGEVDPAATPLANFLKAQSAFDLDGTRLGVFLAENPAAQLSTAEASRLENLQRIHRLARWAQGSPQTSLAEETIALAGKGLVSARQIARMDPAEFARQSRDVLSTERALAIHAQAESASAIALAVLGENSARFNGTGMQALPRLDAQKQKQAAQNAIPDWEELFGSADSCVCEECDSAHGPAAYLVDILQFLSERMTGDGSPQSVKDKLFERRPDLGDLELSCENTNTVLPYIDLVNEILEDAVTPPPTFTPFDLDPTLEAGLGQPVATEGLAAAFHPPLAQGARIETLEAGRRWRIWDAWFTYSVVKESSSAQVVARSRQTQGTAAERRVTPQYHNGAAYEVLKGAVYPLSLPFDRSHVEAKTFLTHLGVARQELIEALSPQSELEDPTSPLAARLAAERLGLADVERQILVGELQRPPEDYWGGAQPGDLKLARALLDRSGLSFDDLQALLATWFVNPHGSLVLSAIQGSSPATCDPAELQVEGLTSADLDRLQRLIRLWRKLGWSLAEVDEALRAFAPDGQTPAITNGILVRIDHLRELAARLRLPAAQVLALFSALGTRGAPSLYASLFDPPSAFQPAPEVFRLLPNGLELANVNALLRDHAGALQAAFRAKPEDLDLLIPRTDGKLTLANLSLLFRYIVLARQLGLTAAELVTMIDLTGLEVFSAARTWDTLRFVEVVKLIRSAGFSVAELDYLVRSHSSPAAPFAPEEQTLAQMLTNLSADLLKVPAPDHSGGPASPNPVESAVIDRVSSSITLPADGTATLLNTVHHGTQTALQVFLALAGPSVPLPIARLTSPAPFETLEKLLKITALIQKLKLPAGLVGWLLDGRDWLVAAPDPQPNPVPLESWFALVELKQARKELGLEDAALEAALKAGSAVAAAAGGPGLAGARQAFYDTLAQWLGWSAVDLESLMGRAADENDLGQLGARIPGEYPGLLLRLARAFALVKRLGVPAAAARSWSGDQVSDAAAAAARAAVKARYAETPWLEAAAPLQEALRDQQRAALVSYLAARPQLWGADPQPADSGELYAHFLIDVEMSSCQLTSRLKQATGSVQLFAQRCLLGLEPGIQTSDGKWLQWQWMKNFRVWEANRKIWLYPENWIEPDLRDDKTPFYKDLESELLQSDLDFAAAEAALLHYLEKLDEVSRLEVAGVYQEDGDKTLHVFGRTSHAPRATYYRRLEGTTQNWTPWEKVELEISGDHLIPVVWNRKLMLIWPIFTEKAYKTDVIMPQPGGRLKSASHYYEIQLAWSEYQHGRWSGKYLSEPVEFAAYEGADNILFNTLVMPPTNLGIALKPVGTGPGTGPVGNPGGTPPPQPQGSASELVLVSTRKISFKAFASETTLQVVGFLRRDYRAVPTGVDTQIACIFGAFRFEGCRAEVTPETHAQVPVHGFALAPAGTKFEYMSLVGTAQGFNMQDGSFRASPLQDNAVDLNQSPSIVGDPSSVLAARHTIQVLDRDPLPYRLLVPHQDLPFVGNRPFFYMDGAREFLVTSTGSTFELPDLTGWVDANVATTWRASFFPTGDGNSSGSSHGGFNGGVALATVPPVVVLRLGPDGRRTAFQLSPVTLQPDFQPLTKIPIFRTTRRYTFVNFHHPYLCDFEKKLASRGIDGLLSLEMQSAADAHSFDAYAPEARVDPVYPVDEVEFQSGRAYAIYNWELFFHIPLLVATRLMANQRFDEAQRWFHYIFNPTGASSEEAPQRYWRTKPFHSRLVGDYEAELVKTVEELIARGASPELQAAVQAWRNNPFNPHAIARLRTTAYQKTVVMKYIDNLIAWGDQEFRRETLESLNAATQLFALAAEILGRRPEIIDRGLRPFEQTFNTLDVQPGGLGNALDEIELLVSGPGTANPQEDGAQTPDLLLDSVLHFCVPENERLLSYWSSVADRLFKLRHCMNIEGQVRQLPLFEPPIDPGLLVRARAAGLNIGDILNDISTPLPHYRFTSMLQRAAEFSADVRSLGAALLSAFEMRDGEALALLHSGQELRLLQSIRDVRQKQVDEAGANIASLEKSREMAQARKDYYESREPLSDREGTSLTQAERSLHLLELSAGSRALAAVLEMIGLFKLGSPTTAGSEAGPAYIGKGLLTGATVSDVTANLLNVSAQIASRRGDFDRRQDEWDYQANLAGIELKQLDQQILAAQIRLAVAERELSNHDQQIDDAQSLDDFLREKFTNQDLFQWLLNQVSGVYFQSYQMAYDLARQAERCFGFELGMPDPHFISFGAWDSLKKGLLAGEKLQHDLRRLEAAYLAGNRREFELTKSISLALTDPLALVRLKETGRCTITLPEELFDLDYPGHYFRRVMSVSLSVPCVVGPYTTLACTVRLLSNTLRASTADGTNGYPRNTDGQGLPTDDPRFIENHIPVSAMATSGAQNDSGMFELSFRDERYLPFEGAGVISTWSLELFSDEESLDFGQPLRQFDYDTISDVILHVRYTAREEAGPFKKGAVAHLRDAFLRTAPAPAMRMFNLRHEFPNQWYRFLNPSSSSAGNVFELDLSTALFNFRDRDQSLKVQSIILLARCTGGGNYQVQLNPPLTPGSDTMTLAPNAEFGGLHVAQVDLPGSGISIPPGTAGVRWRLKMTSPGGGILQPDPATGTMEVEEWLVVLKYGIERNP